MSTINNLPTSHPSYRLIVYALATGLIAASTTAQASVGVETGVSIEKVLQLVHSGSVSLLLNAGDGSHLAGNRLVLEVLNFEKRHPGNFERNGSDNLALLDR